MIGRRNPHTRGSALGDWLATVVMLAAFLRMLRISRWFHQ